MTAMIRKAWSPGALHAYGTILFWTTWTVLMAVTALYFLPWFVGWRRHVPNLGSVAVINILAGWTLVGWVVSMAMACRTLPGYVWRPAE